MKSFFSFLASLLTVLGLIAVVIGIAFPGIMYLGNLLKFKIINKSIFNLEYYLLMVVLPIGMVISGMLLRKILTEGRIIRAPETKELLNNLTSGRIELSRIRDLVDNGADVNADNNAGYTPLLIAADRGDAELVRFLVSRDANLNERSLFGNLTALHFAAKYNDLDMVGTLIEAGASIDAKKDDNETPLDIALINDSNKVIDYLLENNAISIAQQDKLKRYMLNKEKYRKKAEKKH